MILGRPVAATLAAAFVLIGLTAVAPAASAAAGDPTPVAKVADTASHHEFPGATTPAYFEQSSNPGRIWTDKSVFDEDVAVPADVPQPGVGPLVLDDDELAVALSALGSTRHVRGEEQVPIDVSMIIDNSYSMVQCVDASAASDGYCNDAGNWQQSRAYAMAEAVNVAIGVIAEDNPENRVALVQFGTGSGVLRQLGAPAAMANGRYVSLTFSGTTNGTLTLHVEGQTLNVGNVGGTIQSTNIQLGVFTGMQQLASQNSAAVTGDNQRIPNVILFTDGEPTYSSNAASWWSPSAGVQGPSSPGNNQYYGNGFLAAMTASFLKNRVAAVYASDVPGVDATPRVYTIGLGIPALTTNGRNLALATLDPRTWYGDTSNTMSAGFTQAFNAYRSTGSAVVPVNGTLVQGVPQPTAFFTVNRPTATADLPYDPTDLRYNDAYYAPVTQADLISVFRGIAQQIVDAAPNHPVDLADGTATTSGFITFTDPTGQFMHVTDMNRITFCSTLSADPNDCRQQTFLNPTQSTSGDTTTYTFHGLYQASDLYPPTDVSNIVITVQRSAELAVGDVVTVRLPAALLPLRNTVVQEDVDHDPVSMAVTVSHPVHVYYKVAPKPGVTAALADPLSLNVGGSHDGTALAQYVRDHTVGGHVRFYSDDWDVAGIGPGAQARTHSTFVPAQANDFYRFAEDSTIFSDAAAEVPVQASAWDGLAATTALTYRVTRYRQAGPSSPPLKDALILTTTKEALARAGLTAANAVDGLLTAPAGLPDLSTRATNLDHAKCLDLQWNADNLPECPDPGSGNLTGTDVAARTTTWGSGPAVSAALGNNGYLEYEVPGRLVITKRVEAEPGLNPNPQTAFTFAVDLGDLYDGGGTVEYAVYDTANPTAPVRTGELSGASPTLTLLDGQQAEVLGLPDGTEWTVTEQDLPPGYTQTAPTSAEQTGTITVPQTVPASVEFVDTYSPAAATVDGPAVQKVLDGRTWAADDSFDVQLCPAAAPTDCQTVTLTGASPTATFPNRTFDTPGTFTFNLTEVTGQTPGITHSAALYQWVVEVTGDGSGTLASSSTLTRVLDDGGAPAGQQAGTAVFANAFDADAVGVRLQAQKLVNDNTLPDGEQQRDPRLAHDFEFRLLGSGQPDAPAAPLFDGDDSAVVSNTPDSSAVTSPELGFTAEHVGFTYYYAVTEIPRGLAGVTYDDAAFVYRLTVSAAGTPAVVQVATDVCRTTSDALTSAPDGGCSDFSLEVADAVFVNTYDAGPATVRLAGTKVLAGRPWATGDAFTLRLEPSGDDTEAAIASGAVEMPDQTTVTVGAADAVGDAAPFTFDAITFHQQGTFQFRVVEVVPALGIPGIAPDEHWLVVDVTVTDADLDGRLESVLHLHGDADAATFTNRWSGALTLAGIDLEKVLAGRDLALGEFRFSVVPTDESSAELAGIPMGGVTLANGDDTGDPSLTTALAGIEVTGDDLGRQFAFQVSEVAGHLGGVTYDPTVWTVTLVPTFVEESGELDVVVTVSDGERESEFSVLAGQTPRVAFANTYDPASGTATPQFSKTVVGRDWLPGETFTFEIAAVTEGAPMPATTRVVVSHAEAAAFGFGPIVFTEPGEFVYVVSEVLPTDPQPDMAYEGDQALVTVTVTDDGTGALTTSIAYDGDQAFQNVHLPAQPEPPVPPAPPTPPTPAPPDQGGGVLPQTGASVAGLALLAAALTALGILLVRRRREG